MTIKSTFSCIILFLLFGITQNANAQLNVTINKKAGQGSNPVSVVYFIAVFSAPINVATFTSTDILLEGSATGKSVTGINEISPWNGTTFEITVNATSGGSVTASIPLAFTYYTSSRLGTTGSYPMGLVMDNSGNIYTANSQSYNISKITPAGESTIFSTVAGSPSRLIIDESGNLYVCLSDVNAVSKITTDGIATTLGTTGNNPGQLTRDAAGNIYITNAGDANISKITPSGISSILGNTGGVPFGLTIDSEGNLYTTNISSSDVSKVTQDGTSSILASTPIDCYYLTIDGSNNLYVLGSSKITKITPQGISTLYNVYADLSPAGGITIDGEGNLFVANNRGMILKRAANGSVYDTKILCYVEGMSGGIIVDGIGNIYTTNHLENSVSKSSPSGIAQLGSSKAINTASTSTDNTVVLPVTLLSFTAINTNCIAMLKWQTTSEINNSFYAIEYSTNGTSFTQVAKQLSKNSATGANYTYTSNNLMSANAYYRLKMVDIDGNYTYSKTAAVTAGSNCITSLVPNISPNPANGFIVAKGLVKGSHLSLINTNGTQLMAMVAASSSQRIDISHYAKGVYSLRVKMADGTVHSLKFVKQ